MSLSTLLRMDTRSAHLHETEIIPLVMRGRGARKTYIFVCERVYIGLFIIMFFHVNLLSLPPPHSFRAAHSTFQKQDEKEIHRLNGHRIIDYTSVHIYNINSSKGIRLFSSIA